MKEEGDFLKSITPIVKDGNVYAVCTNSQMPVLKLFIYDIKADNWDVKKLA